MTGRRVQLRRSAGWRKPADVVVVSRPSRWGNPWLAILDHPEGPDAGQRWAANKYRLWLTTEQGARYRPMGMTRQQAAERRAWILANIDQLRGRRLGCWCREDEPCHADVLADLADNGLPAPPEPRKPQPVPTLAEIVDQVEAKAAASPRRRRSRPVANPQQEQLQLFGTVLT